MELHTNESRCNWSVSKELGIDSPSYNVFNVWTSTLAIIEPKLKGTVAVTSETQEDEPNCFSVRHGCLLCKFLTESERWTKHVDVVFIKMRGEIIGRVLNGSLHVVPLLY